MTSGDANQQTVGSVELSAHPIDQVLASAKAPQTRDYFAAFVADAEDKKRQGDDVGRRVMEFWASITRLSPEYDTSEGGYDNRIGQLSGATLDCLAAALGDVSDPELRALVGDILWITRHDPAAARVAVASYVASARRLEDPALWPPSVDRLRRALGIAARLGKQKPEFTDVIKAVEDSIARHAKTDIGLMCESLMSLLLAQRIGDPAVYSAIAASIASRLEVLANWFFARTYWQQKAEWDRRAKDIDSANAAKLSAARTYIHEAVAAAADIPPSFMRAAGILAQGVEALRRAKAPLDEVDAAHQRLRDYQLKIPSEMKTVALPQEIVDELESRKEQFNDGARRLVQGHPLRDALARLAMLASIPAQPADLKARAEKHAESAPFTGLMSVSVITETGLTAGTNTPLIGASGDEREAVLLKRIYRELIDTDWPVALDFQIAPAVRTIDEEHSVRLRDFAFIVFNNPFIPEGREGIYARGLYAGFQGDFVMSTHLLIPQLENSIRVLFTRNGIVTTKLSSEGIQEEQDLGWLLRHAAAPNILGEDIAFHLRALLVERFGANLRNVMAHGLLAENQFHAAPAYYLWWLTLRVCALPLVEIESE